MNDEQRAECDKLQAEYGDTERQDCAPPSRPRAIPSRPAPQHRRMPSTGSGSSCAAGRPWAGTCQAAMQGRLPWTARLPSTRSACGAGDGSIPLDLFESDRPAEMRADATTSNAPVTSAST